MYLELLTTSTNNIVKNLDLSSITSDNVFYIEKDNANKKFVIHQ
jgi:hypothetical protein